MRDGEVVEQGYRARLEEVENGWLRRMVQTQALADEKNMPDLGPEVEATSDVETSAWIRAAEVVESSFLHQRRSYFSPRNMRATQLVDVRRASRTARKSVHVAELPRDVALPMPWEVPPPSYNELTAKQLSRASLSTIERAGQSASGRRPAQQRTRFALPAETIADEKGKAIKLTVEEQSGDGRPKPINKSLVELVKCFYPSIPNKPLLFLGFFFCITTGLAPPIFSSLLALLVGGLGSGASPASALKYSLLMLLLAALDGLSQALKYTLLERVASRWIGFLQRKCYGLVVDQDKAFFDLPENTASSLTNSIVKDAEDARNVIGMIAGQLVAVIAMIATGLIWSYAAGWQLALVGSAFVPLIVGSTVLHGKLSTRYEGQNKVLREDLVKQFHQVRSLRLAVDVRSLIS
jgi:ATP-binding cassette subfamily B (MDR/TAP) protein 1